MKRNLITVVLVSLFFGSVSGTVEGVTFCVNTPETFQAALNIAASNGGDDIIRVVQGTYIGNFYYNSSEPFGLTIEGGYSAGTDCSSRTDPPVNTVLDANGSGTVLQLTGSLDAIVDGITLQNGSNSGLIASLGRDLILSNCKIQYNIGGSGGGASLVAKKIDVINNTIMLNVAYFGGGVDIRGGFPDIINFTGNLITQNNANYAEGGGVHIRDTDAAVNFMNNIISYNATTLHAGGGHGGGAHISNGGPVNFVNNTLVGNTTTDCCWGGGVSIYYSTYANVHNNIFWGNNSQTGRDVTFYSIPEMYISLLNNDIDQTPGGIYGLSSIDFSNLNKVDPSFVNLSIEDYHLQPASPCVDSGLNSANIPSTDYDGLPRIVNGIVDMGAYEYQGAIAPTVPDFLGGLREFHYYKLDERIVVKVDVKNRGTKSEPFKVSFYLSDNGVVLGQLIGEATVRKGLNAGQTSTLSSTYTSPTSLSGKYFIAVIDSGDQINEMVETNNRVVVRIP